MDKVYEVQDVNGNWHVVTQLEYVSYRLDGMPVRSSEQTTLKPKPHLAFFTDGDNAA